MVPIKDAHLFLFDIGSDVESHLVITEIGLNDCIELGIDVPNAAYLNFGFLKINLADNEEPVRAVIECSALHPSTNVGAEFDWAGSNAYHSEFVEKPFYRLRFDRPVNVASIEIGNRKGKWGIRLLPLKISCFLHKVQISSGSNFSQNRLDEGMARICESLNQSPPVIKMLIDDSELKAAYEVFVRVRFDDLVSEVGKPDVAEQFKLLLLNALSKTNISLADYVGLGEAISKLVNRLTSTNFSETDWNLLAISIALRIGQADDEINKTVGEFLLRWNAYYPENANGLIRLQGMVDYWSKKLGRIGDVVITRHGWRVSPLTMFENEYLAATTLTLSALRDLGVPAFVSYGTLLGAVRSGKFIPHDDDVDIGIEINETGENAVRTQLQAIANKLASLGIRSSLSSAYDIIQVGFDNLPTGIDIFPCIVDADGCARMAHMAMEYRSLAKNLVFPISTVQISGIDYSAPNKSEDFLDWRYGQGWRIPNQFFEMEWIFEY